MTIVSTGQANAPQFAVIGMQGQGALRHVALLANATPITCGSTVAAHHMAGPGVLVQLPGASVGADVVAWLGGSDALAANEIEGISDWLAEVRTQVGGGMSYIVQPPVARDATTGRTIYRGFSCAGFVAAAYADGAGIPLVDDRALPPIPSALIQQVWGPCRPVLLARFGLEGDGPWPVLLPGYLLHAMQRRRASLPYQPTSADARVP